MRLDKFMVHAGAGTRTEVKKLIKNGRVKVNGITASFGDVHIDEKSDSVCLDSAPIGDVGFKYFLLYKPGGCVSAVKDNLYPTVMEYLEGENLKDCAPAGRLDLDTEGLLIITNDGQLGHRLISPRHKIEKTYFAVLDKPCPSAAVSAFLDGVDIGDDTPTLPAKLIISESDPKETYLTLTEGRFHQVKRMFEAVGCRVTYLRRERVGNLTLEGLSPGEYRRLSPEELPAKGID